MNDREFKDMVGSMAEENHNPDDLARERMWGQIRAKRSRTHSIQRNQFWQIGLATAAILLIGISIGRWTVPAPDNIPVAVNALESGSTVPELFHQTTVDLFSQAEVVLTDFNLSDYGSNESESTRRWATEMLVKTRLLQGAPVENDPEIQNLLFDLELVLAQIINLNDDYLDSDVAWIRSGLKKKSTLNRLRAVNDDRNDLDLI